MALQGTLETFALADVLRLLASTKKTGVLRLDGDRGTGELAVVDGELAGARASGAPLATLPAEVLFELLRYQDGSFLFDTDADAQALGDRRDNVDEALADAEEQLREWREIEQVVPSPTRVLRLVSELDRDVTLSPRQWAAVVAIGVGRTSLELGERLGLSELPATRLARDLVELGVVQVGEESAASAPAPTTSAAVDLAPAPVEVEPVEELVEEPEPVAPVDEAPTAPVIDLHASAPTPPPPPPVAPAPPSSAFAEPPAAPTTPTFGDAPSASSFADAPSFLPEPPPAPSAPSAFAPPSAPPAFAPAPLDGWNDDPDDELSSFHDDPEPVRPLFGEAADGPGPDDPFGPDPFHIPNFGPSSAASAREAEEAAEMARQLANLSPRAQQAVAAAAAASTDEEREQAIARVESDADEPINRNLLLKYLSSIDE